MFSKAKSHVLPFLSILRTLFASELVAEREGDAMERLLQPSSSSTISPSKFPWRASPFLPHLRSSSLGFVSSHRPESRRVSSISCNNLQNPSTSTPMGSNINIDSLNGSPTSSPEAEEWVSYYVYAC